MKSALIAKGYVKKSPIHGYGVFAKQPIAKNEVIEECSCLFIEKKVPALANYVWGYNERYDALPLGAGSLYNHANDYNATYKIDPKKKLMVFTASRPIETDEEIFILYSDCWFPSRGLEPKQLSLHYQLKRPLGKVMRFALVVGAFSGMSVLIKTVVGFVLTLN